MYISTKEKIKLKALSLFASKGYYGTSVSDITETLGLTKSSIYAHYQGKDELFSAVFEDVMSEHGMLFERLIEGSKDLDIQASLRFNFEEYILYFYKNTEIYRFSNQTLFQVPQELFKLLRSDYLRWEMNYRKRLEEIFEEGMQSGIITKGNAVRKVWSFKAKRDGALGWISTSPELSGESIEEFWNDFWLGVKERQN